MFSATVVNPGKTSPLVPHPEGFALHLSQASLSASVKEKTRVSLMIKVADEEPVILCTLCAGVNDTVPLVSSPFRLQQQQLRAPFVLDIQATYVVHCFLQCTSAW